MANRPPKLVGEAKIVPLASIEPNGWNYNVQNNATFTKLVESIKRNGFSQPIVVRAKGKKYQILNGEHRWRAADALGMSEIPVYTLGKISEDRAKQLTVILNELNGDPDQPKLAELLQDINSTVSFDDLAAVMPFPDKELSMYLELGGFDFDKLPDANLRDVLRDDDELPAPAAGAAPSDAPEDEDAPSGAAGAPEETIGKIQQIKFQLTHETANEIKTKLAELNVDPNIAFVNAVREYHKAEMERRGERKAKARTAVKRVAAKRKAPAKKAVAKKAPAKKGVRRRRKADS